MSEPQCYFGVQLDTQCHKLEFCQSTGTVTLTDLEEDIQEILLCKAGLLGHEGEWTICNLFSSSTIVWKCVWENS